jgi:gamma-glutamyl hercynylcysteine S-oxide synthase
VVHVSFYDAEWEKAASWDPDTGTRRLFPWGDEVPTTKRTNLDQLAFRPAATLDPL